MALTKSDLQDIGALVRDAINETVPEIVDGIIRTELKAELEPVQLIQSQQARTLQAIQIDLRGLKSAYREQSILLEDLESRFDILAKVVGARFDKD